MKKLILCTLLAVAAASAFAAQPADTVERRCHGRHCPVPNPPPWPFPFPFPWPTPFPGFPAP